MALNFPSAPNVNDTYTFSDKTWTYNGNAWVLSYGALNTGVVSEGSNLYFSNARVYSNVTQLGYITSSSLSGYATNAQLTSYATTANSLSQFASTTSAQLATLISNETGTGNLVFATSPTLVTPVLGTPSSGTLSNCTVDGTNEVGFKNVPQNSQSAAYTLVLADAGKHIFHPSTDANARTFTIPANSSVAYPIGTVIAFANMTSQVVTIAITTDTMYLGGQGTTGSRSLAQYGIANALKITSTAWVITGTGLT